MFSPYLRFVWPSFVMAAVVAGCANPGSPFAGHTPAKPTNSVQLETAVSEVEDAIRYYKSKAALRSQTHGLPPLSKIDFEFQTTTDVSAGLNAGLYVFALNASAQRSTTHDVTYSYQRLPFTGEKYTGRTPPPLLDELTQTITTTVDAARAAQGFGPNPFNTLIVKIQFGFKKTGQVAVNVPVPLVPLATLGINAQADKNSVQSVTLTFGSH